MLDPRIYRTGLVAVALAVIVLAFSLGDQQGPQTTTLAPEAFNGRTRVRHDDPARRSSSRTAVPGRRPTPRSPTQVGTALASDGFSVVQRARPRRRRPTGSARSRTSSASGPASRSGAIVVVAHRDALGSPATAEASGTARARGARPRPRRARPIAARSCSPRPAARPAPSGALALAKSLPCSSRSTPCVVLGDMAGHRPAPAGRRAVVERPGRRAADAAQHGRRGALAAGAAVDRDRPSIGGQFAHLAFPFTATEQGPFGAEGEPAVLMSVSGDRAPGRRRARSPERIAGMGRTALADGQRARRPDPTSRRRRPISCSPARSCPAWAIRLFVLALIVPVLAATIDGMARARRRGHPILRWVTWVLASALPFVLALVAGARRQAARRVRRRARRARSAADAVPPHSAGIVVLAPLRLPDRDRLRCSCDRRSSAPSTPATAVWCPTPRSRERRRDCCWCFAWPRLRSGSRTRLRPRC